MAGYNAIVCNKRQGEFLKRAFRYLEIYCAPEIFTKPHQPKPVLIWHAFSSGYTIYPDTTQFITIAHILRLMVDHKPYLWPKG